MRVLGIIFDLDGVLVLSSDIHRRAYESVLERSGIHSFDYARFAGMRTRDCLRIVLEENGQTLTEHELTALATEKSRIAYEHLAADNVVAPGAIELLQSLSARFTLALASSASRKTVDLFLDRFNVRALFSSVLAGEDVKVAKPDPTIYLESCARIGLAPGDCLVVEDARSGIAAAKAAGIRVVAIPTTESREMLAQAGADVLIDHLADLLTLVVPTNRVSSRDAWTAIIPAAGRGTRLGFDKPKILFPVAGRPILEWLIRCLESVCGHFVFVLSPQGRELVEAELQRLIPGRFSIGIQPEPLGMGDAVSCGLPLVETSNALIVWGDQVALKPESIARCIAEFEGSGALAALPTVWREKPYIHFSRDSAGRITGVLQAREGDTMPLRGESDTGLFLFRTGTLRSLLESLRARGLDRGAATGESNFLPVFSLFGEQAADLVSPQVMTLEETVGINSLADAIELEPLLAVRAGGYAR